MNETLAPSFDNWTSLFLMVSAFGLFLTILLLSNRAIRKYHWPIALLVFGFSLIIIQYVFFWTGYRTTYPFVHAFDGAWYFAFGPLLYHYIHTIYKGVSISKWHFLLPVIILLGSFIYFNGTKGMSTIEFVSDQPFFQIFWSMKSPWNAGLSMSIYLLLSFELIKSGFMDDSRPQEQEVLRNWSIFIVRFFCIFLLAYFSYFILARFPFFNSAWDYTISIVLSIGIYGCGIMAYRQPQIFNGEWFKGFFFKDSKTDQELEARANQQIFDRILDHMANHKPYLDPNLRLVHLADQLGYSSHLLSEVINQAGNKNFNQFINDFRLQEAVQLLLDTDMSVKSIYFATGFSNKVTFYKAFRSRYGNTPTDFRKDQQLAQLSINE